MKLKTAIIYGFIAGFVMIFGWWVSNLLLAPAPGEVYDFSRGELLGYSAMILALTSVFVGVRNYRNKVLGGAISFKQAFLIGLYIVLVASAIYVIGWMIYYPNFMPDFADQYAVYQVQQYKEAGMTESEIAVKQAEMDEWMKAYENPFVMAGITFMEIFPIGLIVSLISAFALKKK